MSASTGNETLCMRLLDINQEAFAARQYNVAYHALVAALHWAADAADEQCLREISRKAARQIRTIDARSPQYQHSTASARARGRESIWALLIRQAEAHAIIVVQNRNRWNVRRYERASGS